MRKRNIGLVLKENQEDIEKYHDLFTYILSSNKPDVLQIKHEQLFFMVIV